MSNGLLYCKERDTDCMEMYIGQGTCNLEKCVRDDPVYLEKEREIERRRKELYEKNKQHRQEEKTAAKSIRRQTKPEDKLLREQIKNTKSKMERYYTRGWTRAADKLSREIIQMERRLKSI